MTFFRHGSYVKNKHGFGDAVADRKGDGFAETGAAVHVSSSTLPSLFGQRFQCCGGGGEKLDAGRAESSGFLGRLERFSSSSSSK